MATKHTENLSTLKIHKMSQATYEKLVKNEIDGEQLDENAIYLTPDNTEELINKKINDDVGSIIEDKILALQEDLQGGTINLESYAKKTDLNEYAKTIDIENDYTKTINLSTNIKLKEKLTVNVGDGESVGGYKTGDVIDTDASFAEILAKLLRKSTGYNYIAPALYLVSNIDKYAEIGTKIAPMLTASFSKHDGGDLQNIVIDNDEDAEYVLASGSNSMLKHQLSEQVLTSDTTYYARATYAAGESFGEDNLGDVVKNPYDGSMPVTASITFKPFIEGCFYGFLTTEYEDDELSSTILRDNDYQYTSGGSYWSGKTLQLTVPDSNTTEIKSAFVACPAESIQVTLPLTMDLDITTTFRKLDRTVKINGANDYEIDQDYNIWMYTPDKFTPGTKFSIKLN